MRLVVTTSMVIVCSVTSIGCRTTVQNSSETKSPGIIDNLLGRNDKKPAALSLVRAECMDTDGSCNSLKIFFATQLDALCENKCPIYSLAENRSGRQLNIEAMMEIKDGQNKVVPLQTERTYSLQDGRVDSIMVRNIGGIGANVSIRDEMRQNGASNYLIIQGTVKTSFAIGGESPGYLICLGDEKYEAEINDNLVINAIQNDNLGHAHILARGVLENRESVERGKYKVLRVVQAVLTPHNH